MNLIDDEDILYSLLTNKAAFVTSKFQLTILLDYYKVKYSALISKYDSLLVYLEFVLSKIIYSSEAKLKSACASRVVRIPTTGYSGLSNIFKIRKRGADDVEMNNVSKKSTNVKHPFLNSDEYISKPTLYTIGKCCEYIIPSEFAELYANVQYESVTRISTGQARTTRIKYFNKFSNQIIEPTHNKLGIERSHNIPTYLAMNHHLRIELIGDVYSLSTLDQ